LLTNENPLSVINVPTAQIAHCKPIFTVKQHSLLQLLTT
jgi:hypothetical protein